MIKVGLLHSSPAFDHRSSSIVICRLPTLTWFLSLTFCSAPPSSKFLFLPDVISVLCSGAEEKKKPKTTYYVKNSGFELNVYSAAQCINREESTRRVVKIEQRL